jgi:hypothetical protein
MEERVKKLETITTRLMRRAHKHVVGLITPYPISNSVAGEKVEGVILRYMFPCNGTITKGMINLITKPKKWVSINIKIFNDSTSSIKGFTVEKKSMTVEPNLPVKAGDCLELSLVTSPEDIVKEVWISFLWAPSMKDVTAKSFLISELENDILDGERLITDRSSV